MRNNITRCLSFLLTIFFYKTFAQPGCPSLDAGQDISINCSQSSCTTLTATAVLPGGTNTYTISSIPYNPPFPLNAGTQLFINIDDIWSGAINLPFPFCFFGNTYNQIVVGTNGVISFDLSYAGGYCNWSFSASAPSNIDLPLNAIFGPYHDIDPSVCGEIRYAVLGSPPCRTFVVNYNGVCHFYCNNLTSTSQIVLYETTNIIEVYVQSKPTCSSWNYGNAIIGIQNASGTTAFVPPGRNTGPWTVSTPEAWRFTPNGNVSYTINWYELPSMTNIGSGLSQNVCPFDTTDYVVQVNYPLCGGGTLFLSDTVRVNVNNPAAITITSPGDTTVCNGTTLTLQTQVGQSGGNYLWSPGGQTTPSITISPSQTTTYTVSYTVGPCSANDSVTITVIPAPTIVATDTSLCSGGTATLYTQVSVPGGNYSWSPGNQTSSSITVSPSQTSQYVVTYSLQGCSPAYDTATVTIVPPPSLSVSGDTALCQGESTTITLSGAYSYLWQPGNLSGNSQTFSPPSSATYLIIGSTPEGCSDSIYVTIFVHKKPTASLSFAPDSICGNGCIELINNSSAGEGIIASVVWYFDDGTTSTENTSPLSHCYSAQGNTFTQIYPALLVTNSGGCKDSIKSPVPLILKPVPVADFLIPSPPLKPNTDITFDNTSTGATSFLWQWLDQTDNHTDLTTSFASDGIVTICLSAYNLYGCSDSICKPITLEDELLVPNIITPNGDGMNDKLVIKGIYGSGNSIAIYNRWGKKIYENANYQNDWDGTINGKKASNGTYYYILVTNRGIEKNGFITILDQ